MVVENGEGRWGEAEQGRGETKGVQGVRLKRDLTDGDLDLKFRFGDVNCEVKVTC